MPKSLQDQLLNAGVANRKQQVKANKAKKQKIKQRKSGVVVEDEAAIRSRNKAQAKVLKDRELNRQRDDEAAQKAALAQVRQIIEHARLQRSQDGDVRFNFTDGSSVKYLNVTKDQSLHLAKGFLAIARYEQRYELIPATAAEKISIRENNTIVTWNKHLSIADGNDTNEDDPYADYKIPDDLIW